MQLNPARGRKRVVVVRLIYVASGCRFMQLNPARGRKQTNANAYHDQLTHGLCSSTPRGDGNSDKSEAKRESSIRGLCSSTPRGDGNEMYLVDNAPACYRFMQLNPARGRKLTVDQCAIVLIHCNRFMQLNPARGRKRV